MSEVSGNEAADHDEGENDDEGENGGVQIRDPVEVKKLKTTPSSN